MSFPKALQLSENEDALRRWRMAKTEYSQACSTFTKLRLLADHPNATDESIVRYARLRKTHSLVAKKFFEERALFIRTVKGMKKDNFTLSDKEYTDLFEAKSSELDEEISRESELSSAVSAELIEDVIKKIGFDPRQKPEPKRIKNSFIRPTDEVDFTLDNSLSLGDENEQV